MGLDFPFDNSYARLPDRFYTRQLPTPVARPELIAWNGPLAADLGLPELSEATLAEIFSGNTLPGGAEPLSQAYAGHQFGGWVPQLGDGRAVLLGEVIDSQGKRRDIQLKGSGPTPYSRMGDGRAWLGPVLREYLVSEAMHALGIPTTRALAAVATGETVLREAPLPGAVLTRVAASHLRVGTFQFFAARGDTEALQALLAHAAARHAPGADTPAALLDHTIRAQAKLVAQWMGVGFIHGVMNTDNCTISGETIDYGPCAFMDTYRAGEVFSSIDQMGRYAFANQPRIAAWNLAQLATSLLPLMPDQEAAIEEFTAAVNGFADHYSTEWQRVFAAKLGFAEATDQTTELAVEFLKMMESAEADFTNSFRALAEDPHPFEHEAMEDWHTTWTALGPDRALIARTNPAVIPRNHRIEALISSAVAGDLEPFRHLGAALARPFSEPEDPTLSEPPTPEEVVPATFCGT